MPRTTWPGARGWEGNELFKFQVKKLRSSYVSSSLIFTGLDLESGAQYYVIVKAINFAGLVAEAFSDGFTVDFTPPAASQARLGSGLDQLYQSDLNKLSVR